MKLIVGDSGQYGDTLRQLEPLKGHHGCCRLSKGQSEKGWWKAVGYLDPNLEEKHKEGNQGTQDNK